MSDPTQLPPAPLLPSALQAAVEAHLLGEGWNYVVDPDYHGQTTSVRLWNKRITFRLEYTTHESRARVLLQLVPELFLPDTTRKEVALLLCWMNAYLQCTTFHLIPGRAEIRVRIALAGDLGQQVDAEHLGRITDVAICITEGYLPLIREVALGKATAEQMVPRLPDPWT